MQTVINFLIKAFVNVLLQSIIVPACIWVFKTIYDAITLQKLKKQNESKGKAYEESQGKDAAKDTFNKLP